MDDLGALLRDQLAYYRARAGEYDEVYEQRDTLAMRATLIEELPIGADVLELACGTGQWTAMLAAAGRRVTAVDGAPEMLAVARRRLAGTDVAFVEADLFEWQPQRAFDTVFFAFWLSHVPPSLFARFWELVAAALRPGGRAVFVDVGPAEEADEEVLPGQPAPAVRRTLKDGSRHRVVKVFPAAEALAGSLRALGWSAEAWPVGTHFVAGVATPPHR